MDTNSYLDRFLIYCLFNNLYSHVLLSLYLKGEIFAAPKLIVYIDYILYSIILLHQRNVSNDVIFDIFYGSIISIYAFNFFNFVI